MALGSSHHAASSRASEYSPEEHGIQQYRPNPNSRWPKWPSLSRCFVTHVCYGHRPIAEGFRSPDLVTAVSLSAGALRLLPMEAAPRSRRPSRVSQIRNLQNFQRQYQCDRQRNPHSSIRIRRRQGTNSIRTCGHLEPPAAMTVRHPRAQRLLHPNR